jgi:hypothetical protein
MHTHHYANRLDGQINREQISNFSQRHPVVEELLELLNK